MTECKNIKRTGHFKDLKYCINTSNNTKLLVNIY